MIAALVVLWAVVLVFNRGAQAAQRDLSRAPGAGRRLLAALVLVALGLGCVGPSAVCVPKRDSDGRISRSGSVRREFLRRTGYPSGRPGYIIDHIVPLCACGKDAVENLQWQTVAEAREKDKRERAQCDDD